MSRPDDPRGADRRKPSTFGAETGYDQPHAPAKPRLPYRQLRAEIPDCGCHGYEAHGVMWTRCEKHAPTGGVDRGPVRGQCVECVTGNEY